MEPRCIKWHHFWLIFIKKTKINNYHNVINTFGVGFLLHKNWFFLEIFFKFSTPTWWCMYSLYLSTDCHWKFTKSFQFFSFFEIEYLCNLIHNRILCQITWNRRQWLSIMSLSWPVRQRQKCHCPVLTSFFGKIFALFLSLLQLLRNTLTVF